MFLDTGVKVLTLMPANWHVTRQEPTIFSELFSFTMPKRRRVVDSESDAFSDPESDFSIHEVPKSKRTSKARKTTHQTRQIAPKEFTNQAMPSGSATTPSHTSSIHIVATSDVGEIRESLLEWYDKVHDVRGMPWRKRYNPSLGREDRAQRAYEVCMFLFSQAAEDRDTCGHRFGYPKLCYSKRRLPQ